MNRILSSPIPEPLKCVFIGDRGIGKTSLSNTYASGSFPEDVLPIQDDVVHVTVGGKIYALGLWDTRANRPEESMASVAYLQTRVFLLCFNVADPDSFAHIENTWLPSIKPLFPDIPYILVGLQIDKRDNLHKTRDIKISPVTTEMGERLAQKLEVNKYLECSALTQQGVKEVFDEAIAAATGFPFKPKKRKFRALERENPDVIGEEPTARSGNACCSDARQGWIRMTKHAQC